MPSYQLTVNGNEETVDVLDDTPLLWVLRDALEMTGTKFGCGRGLCGACTVHLDGEAVRSCQVRISDAGELSVDRVVSAVDCGLVVNPAGARAQVEGAIVYGLSAALYGEITVERGRVVQSNFHDYQPLRITEMPEVEIHFVEGADTPQGMGEPPLPPVAPALTAAIHDATGVRIRRLPIEGRHGAWRGATSTVTVSPTWR